MPITKLTTALQTSRLQHAYSLSCFAKNELIRIMDRHYHDKTYPPTKLFPAGAAYSEVRKKIIEEDLVATPFDEFYPVIRTDNKYDRNDTYRSSYPQHQLTDPIEIQFQNKPNKYYARPAHACNSSHLVECLHDFFLAVGEGTKNINPYENALKIFWRLFTQRNEPKSFVSLFLTNKKFMFRSGATKEVGLLKLDKEQIHEIVDDAQREAYLLTYFVFTSFLNLMEGGRLSKIMNKFNTQAEVCFKKVGVDFAAHREAGILMGAALLSYPVIQPRAYSAAANALLDEYIGKIVTPTVPDFTPPTPSHSPA